MEGDGTPFVRDNIIAATEEGTEEEEVDDEDGEEDGNDCDDDNEALASTLFCPSIRCFVFFCFLCLLFVVPSFGFFFDFFFFFPATCPSGSSFAFIDCFMCPSPSSTSWLFISAGFGDTERSKEQPVEPARYEAPAVDNGLTDMPPRADVDEPSSSLYLPPPPPPATPSLIPPSFPRCFRLRQARAAARLSGIMLLKGWCWCSSCETAVAKTEPELALIGKTETGNGETARWKGGKQR